MACVVNCKQNCNNFEVEVNNNIKEEINKNLLNGKN